MKKRCMILDGGGEKDDMEFSIRKLSDEDILIYRLQGIPVVPLRSNWIKDEVHIVPTPKGQ